MKIYTNDELDSMDTEELEEHMQEIDVYISYVQRAWNLSKEVLTKEEE